MVQEDREVVQKDREVVQEDREVHCLCHTVQSTLFAADMGGPRPGCFCRLSAAEDNYRKFGLWPWTLRAVGQECLEPSAP